MELVREVLTLIEPYALEGNFFLAIAVVVAYRIGLVRGRERSLLR